MKILVVHKTSRYQQLILEQKDEEVASLLAQGDISVAKLEISHNHHTESLEHVQEVLTSHGLEFDVVPREDSDNPGDYDLVIPVGGDGTVLDLSHRVGTTPVLAINSDPTSSVGYFCAGSAEHFAEMLEDTLEQRWKPTGLRRFAVCINDDERTPPVLNETLVCHANPAAVSSYLLDVNGRMEAHRSSGIWIATPAGSTAAIRSAGGMVLPMSSNNYQFVVREPYQPPNQTYRQIKGIRPFGTPIEIVSKMQEGRIYVDGPHICHNFRIGDRLTLDFDVPQLDVFGLDDKRRNA